MSGDRTPVDARDESLPNSPIGDQDEDVTVIADKSIKCQWNGVDFTDGDSVCAEGVLYECHYGSWMKASGSC